MNTEDYEKLVIDPIFEPIKKLFEFYILGVLFVGQTEFQKIILEQIDPNLNKFLDRYNKEVNLRKEGSSVKSETGTYMVTIGRIMAIAIFNILEFSEYNESLNRTEIFKFAKHLRNGAAHNNKFNFAKPVEEPIKWRELVIQNSLRDTPVFNEFINPIELIYLIADISSLIKTHKDPK